MQAYSLRFRVSVFPSHNNNIRGVAGRRHMHTPRFLSRNVRPVAHFFQVRTVIYFPAIDMSWSEFE